MSFGGGTTQYNIDYKIRVINEGGTGAFSQINNGFNQAKMGATNVSLALEKMSAANEKVIQAGQGVSKAAKGMAFGFLGIATAGAEAIGMFSMYKQTQAAVTQAQNAQSKALEQGGKQSKAYKDATNELAKANRWARMTFRNLMLSMFDLIPFFVLSVNGIMKLRNAYKLLKEAQLEQKAMRQVLATAGIKEAAAANLANASYASLSKSQRLLKAEQTLGITATTGLTTATKGLSTEQKIMGTGALANIATFAKTEKSMGSVAKASIGLKSGFVAAGAAVGSFSKKVLPILAVIGAIVVAVEAWKNNWGGFGDVVNQVGVEIGNIHPILQQAMMMFAKIGDSIDALIHGDFDRLKEIWSGQAEAMDEATEKTKEEEQALKKLKDTVEEFQSVSGKLLVEASQGDKKEQRTFLKMLGIKGDEKEEMRDVLDEVEKFTHEAESAAAKLEALEGFNLLEKLGMDIPDDVIKDIQNTIDSDLRDMISGDNDPFSKLADILEKSPNKEAYGETLTKWVAENPGVLEALRQINPRLASAIESYIAKFGIKAQEELDKTKLTIPENAIIMADEDVWDKEFEGLDNEKRGDGKMGGGGGFATKLLEDITEQIRTADWSALGTAIGDKFRAIMTPENLATLGANAKTYIVDPILAAIYGAFKPEIEAFQKDPVGTILGGINAVTLNISSFVAGLFGYKTEQEMFTSWENQLTQMFASNPILTTLRAFIHNPVGTLISLLRGGTGDLSDAETEGQAEEIDTHEKAPLGGITILAAEIFEKIGLQGFLVEAGKAYDMAVKVIDLAKDTLGYIIRNPIGWLNDIWASITGQTAQKSPEARALDAKAAQISKDLGITDWISEVQKMYQQIESNISGLFGDLGLLVTNPPAWLAKHLKMQAEANKTIPNKGNTSKSNNATPNSGAEGNWIMENGKWVWKKTSSGDNGVWTGQGQLSNVQMLSPAFTPKLPFTGGPLNPAEGNVISNSINAVIDIARKKGAELSGKFWDVLFGGTSPIPGYVVDKATGKLVATIQEIQKQIVASGGGFGGAILGISPDTERTGLEPGSETEKFMKAQQAKKNAPAGVDIAGMQKQNIAGAGVFASLATAAANASKAIQTEFSSMFTALQGIFTGIATEWSKDMNSLGTNAASGNSQVQEQFVGLLDACTTLFLAIAEAWSADMISMIDNAAAANTGVQEQFIGLNESAITLFLAIAEEWSADMTSMIDNSAAANEGVQEQFVGMHESSVELFENMAQLWSENMAEMANNAKDAAKGIENEFSSMVTSVGKAMSNLSKHWSSMLSNMKSDTKSAVSSMKSELEKLNFTVTTKHVVQEITEHISRAEGGMVSFAEGGVISAAKGRMLTTSGPTYLLGDNPGGRESLWAIPHNNPMPTVGDINATYGYSTKATRGGTALNQQITLHISGNSIVNEQKLNKRIRVTMGQRMDRFGSI